jgi:hypothetical protein
MAALLPPSVVRPLGIAPTIAVGCLLVLVLTGCGGHCLCGGAARGRGCGSECVGPAGYCGEQPRFHPVPTEPVFAPRSYAVAVFPPAAQGEEVPRGPATPLPSGKASSGRVEPVPVPMPAPPLTESKVPPERAAPQRLDVAANGTSSWVFAPPLPATILRKDEPSVEVKSDPADKAAAQKGAKP